MKKLTTTLDLLLLVMSALVAYATYETTTRVIPVQQADYYKDLIEGVDWLGDYKLRFQYIVLAQAIHETDSFKSNIFKDCHNLFGMKVASRRPTTAVGKCRGHASYNGYADSVKDYALWQMKYLPLYEARHGRVTTDEQYYKFLRYQRYAEDEAYIVKLRKWVKTIQQVY